MGRHADVPAPRVRRRRPRGALRLGVPVFVLVLAVTCTSALAALPGGSPLTQAGRRVLAGLERQGSQAEGCDRVVHVRVAASGALVPALRTVEALPLGPSPTGVCAQPRMIELGPAEALASLVIGVDGQRRPDVWIPDSSLWATRARDAGVAVEEVDRLGSSPVVVASSTEVLEELGWQETPPTWADVLSTDRALAVPDLADSAGALMAIDLARQTTGQEAAVVVEAVLARQRAGGLTPSEGMTRAALDGADAPLVITSEQEVLRRAAGAERVLVTAVGPRGGTPVLDHPVLAVPPSRPRTDDEQVAVDQVLTALSGVSRRAVALAAGLRDQGMAPLPGSPPMLPVGGPFVQPDPDRVSALVADLGRLAPPSRLLVAVDVSASMDAQVTGGLSRAEVAAEALQRALADLPSTTRVGVWYFASDLDGGTDHVEVAPVQELGTVSDGRPHRAAVDEAVAGIPGATVGGGTALYGTVDAAMAAARQGWSNDVVTTVLLITDGRNEDSDGLSLDALRASLAEAADPARPVGLVAVGFGPDADLAALQQVAAAASGGGPAQAVPAREPDDLRAALVQLLAARTVARSPGP